MSSMESCEQLDPRIRRTRLMLQQALDKLLETKEFDHISVNDITEQATVNRATFYDHYGDKFALLQCLVGTRFNEMMAERKLEFDGTCGTALQNIALTTCEYLARLQGPNGARQVAPHMESAMIAVLRRMFLEGLKLHPPKSGVSPEMVAATASWAIYGAAKEWLESPDRVAPQSVALTMTLLVAPLLHVA